MFGRKNKPEPEQGRAVRQVQRTDRPTSTAFSYYTSRTPDINRARMHERQDPSGQPGQSKQITRRPFSAQLPFWVFVTIALVCLFKVLVLSTTPKVIVLGKSSVAASYLQPSTVYAAAAHKLLSSSITNRTKLTVNLDGTAQALERQFPELQTASLGLQLIGSRPIVYVQVAQPSLVLQTTHGSFALNKSGLVLARIQTVPAGIPVAVDQSGATPHLGKQFLPSSTVMFMQTVAYQLSAAHLPLSTFVLPSGSPYELDVRLDSQPYLVRFNLQEDALTQSGVAVATIQQLGGTVPAQYVDVRVPGRVYYK